MSSRLFATILVLALICGFGTLAATSAANWNIAGTWALDFKLGSSDYLHTMDVTSFKAHTGAFSGTGTYNPDSSYTWTVSGTESGQAVSYHILYTGTNAGYTVDAVGTLSVDGLSMSGTWTDSNSQSGTWTATGTAVCATGSDRDKTSDDDADVRLLCGAKKALDLQYKVVNDEDSGFKGYWALDDYTKHVRAWKLTDGTYYANVDYEGEFNTFATALSPQNGVSEPKDARGRMEGGYTATFDATGLTGASTHVGTQNLGGTKADILLGTYGNGQTGNPGSYDYLSTFFTSPTNFNYVHWGWTYTYKNQVWKNFDTGSSGDIVS